MYYIYRQAHDGVPVAAPEPGLVSAIIPVYGRKLSTLSAALACIDRQRYRPIEVLVVGNGLTADALQPHIQACRVPVRLLSLERNTGAAFARNYGATHARGDLFWFMDSDVYDAHPECADTVRRIFERNADAGVVGGIIFRDQHRTHFSVGRTYRIFAGEDPEPDRVFEDDFTDMACAFVPRRVFGRVGGMTDFIEYPFDDVEFGYKVRAAGFRCLGSFRCAGAHPLHPVSSSVFKQFMTMHNLLLHLLLNYDRVSFAALLRRKHETGWRISRPGLPPTGSERLRAAWQRAAGSALACGHLLFHAATVARLRRDRQNFLRRSQYV